MEIELRAKIEKEAFGEIIQKVESFGGELESVSEQKDTYYKHSSDSERDMIIRIRRAGDNSQLTFKARVGDVDTAWTDIDLDLKEPDKLEKILTANKYIEVVKIEKNRRSYKLDSFEINLDSVKELGFFIEIERIGAEGERDSIEKEIIDLLMKLGIGENDVISKGYVPLMLEVEDR